MAGQIHALGMRLAAENMTEAPSNQHVGLASSSMAVTPHFSNIQ